MIKSINIKGNWKLTKVKNHLKKKPNAIVDGPFGTQLHNDEYVKMGIPVVRITNLDYNCYFNPKNLVYITEEKYKELKRSSIEKGDIIIGKTGATIGKSGIFNDFEKGIVSSSCLKISLDDTILSNFFRFVVVSDFFKEEIYNKSSGSTRDTINISEMKNIEFFIPSSIEEQGQIAKYLEHKTTKIEKIITKNKKLITLLKEKRTSLINQTITKGLNPDTQMKESGIEWIGKIPLNWSLKKINHLLYERREKNNPIKSRERLSLSIDKGITLYADKTTNLDRFKEDFTQYKLAYPGDLVLNSMNMIVGAVGVSNYFGCVSPVYYTYYDNTDENYTTRFCEYFFKLPTVKQYLKSIGKGIMSIERGNDRINTCRLKISRDDLKNIHVPIPPKEVQKEILSYLDYKTQKIDRTIERIEKNIELLEEYKESLIHHVVTGKIDVRGVEI